MAISKLKIPNIIILAVIIFAVGLLFFSDKLFAWLRPAPQKSTSISARLQAKQKEAAPADPRPDVPAMLAERYKTIAKSVDTARVKTTVYDLSSYPSRMVGYPGCEEAAKYVEQQFKAVGLKGVRSESFKVTVPVDEGSKLVLNGQEIPIYSLWPNLVRTSQLPPQGLDVHLIDAAGGKLPDFDDKVVRGSAALVDFNSGTEWLNAPRLGAKVLLFVEPESTMRGEGEAKFSSIPVSMPRFWISKENAAKIRAMIKDIQAKNAHLPVAERPKLEAKVFCKMPWEKVESRNIIGVIPGSDPKLKDQWIVLHASYDGTSVVPALAPSAESTCGIAALLELARIYQNPELAPRRSVMFIATSAHFQGLAGMREFVEKHIDSYRFPGTMDNIHAKLNNYWPKDKKGAPAWLVPVIMLAVLGLVTNSVYGRLRSAQRKYPWLVIIPLVLAAGSVFAVVKAYGTFARGFDYRVPNPQKFYLWAGLDLTSQTEGVGILYKGYFYDYREDLQGKFSDLASRTRENSERIAHTLGFFDQRGARFADGVNPIQGKNWRNFVPGKIALDSEVVTLAGGKGVSFVSIDDGRQLVDTPFDTRDKVNIANLGKQVEMIACLVDHWFRETNEPDDELKMAATPLDSKTVALSDPLQVGYILGVYTNKDARGTNYFKPKDEKKLTPLLSGGKLKLTTELPAGTKQVYVLHKPLTKLGVAKDDPCKFTRMGLQGGFARLSGNVVQYDPRKSFVPNLRVGDCLAVVRSNHKSFMGVRATIVDKTTRDEGYFQIPGVAPVTAGGRGTMTSIGAYKLDPVRGDIICAPDQGSYGQFYPTEFPITTGAKDMPIIVFNCKAVSIYDLIDPQSLKALPGMSVYEGDTNGAPRQFGVAVAIPEPQNPHIEDMAVIFTEDTAKSGSLAVGSSEEVKRIRLKLVMSAGPAANRLLLLNSTLGSEVVPARVVARGVRALPADKDWEVGIQGAYLDEAAKGKNFYLFDPSNSDTWLANGVVNLTPEFAKQNNDASSIYIRTTQNRIVPANVVKVLAVDKPWYSSVAGIFTDSECKGRNYLLAPPTKGFEQCLASDEVCIAPDTPTGRDKYVYAKTDAGDIIKVRTTNALQKAYFDENPLQVVVKGVYANRDYSGENYYLQSDGDTADVLIAGGGPLLKSMPNSDEVWIQTNQPRPIRAKVAKTITVDKPIQFFVEGVYADTRGGEKDQPKVAGPNYCKFQSGVFNNPSLLHGEIQLTSDLPEGTKTVYVKPAARPEGIGYDVTDGGTLDETAYKVAKDMWTLDEFRLSRLESKGVKNEGLSDLHAQGRRNLDLAEAAKGSFNYSVFDSYCRSAWGYEARAYPDITSTAQDVVNGVIFYLFLMLPFAFFCERLFFASPNLGKQILYFFLIFIGIFITFRFVHPAFQIAGNALVVLIAFVMLALSILVIFIITSKFEEQLKQFNRSVSGIHKADIGRMSVAAAAFSLGISNMRRRKARTVLTCITLVLLTFTVLSFTSIVSTLRFNKVPAKKDADTHIYQGIMIRTAMWESMQEVAYRLLKDEFGNEGKRGKVYPVAPRAWFFGTTLGEQSFLTLRKSGLAYDAKAAVGMTPDEAEIMDFAGKNQRMFVAGDWFGYKDGKRVAEEVDPYSIIIPDAIAEKLEIKPADVGKAKIEFAGAKYTVVGIVRNEVLKKIKDLDNEPLTPVDYILMSKQSQQQQSMGEAGFREYTHHEPNNVFFVPFDTLMSMGGEVKSIAIKFASFDEVQGQLEALMPRLGLNLYAGVGDSIYRYSSIAASSSKGFSNVFIPVLIAALIVLNTMLGSVFERVREIGIFSSIGLAPNHIAVLFIAESMVYANLGAVAGYVIGQAASKLLLATNILPGLYLNFSSMSAVTSTLVVVAVVLLSTLYPARKASEVATPAVDRSWKVPDPVGDNWDIVLPFAVTGEQAAGVNGFLQEWFQAYEEYSIGDFVTQDVRTGQIDTENGAGYEISCKAWLAPFDLGVSQTVRLRTLPTTMEDVYEVKLRITRESGDISNWKRVNRRFLNTLRKQFLIWRTLRAEDREKYLQAALQDAAESKGPEVAPA